MVLVIGLSRIHGVAGKATIEWTWKAGSLAGHTIEWNFHHGSSRTSLLTMHRSDEDVRHVLVLAQQRQMQNDLQRRRIRCQNHQVGQIPVQRFGGLVRTAFQLSVADRLLSQIQNFGRQNRIGQRVRLRVHLLFFTLGWRDTVRKWREAEISWQIHRQFGELIEVTKNAFVTARQTKIRQTSGRTHHFDG